MTQGFGERPEYYKQFGLKAHEGLDIIPTGSIWDILCLADGVVVNESDDPRSGAYGIWLTVWHPTLRKATQYCHLKENYVEPGDKVVEGKKIGVMGKSGNVTGAHLHLNLFETDENGVRLNRNNGYLGGIDPFPFLQQDNPESTTPQQDYDACRLARDSHWNDLVSLKDALGVTGEYSITTMLSRAEQLFGYELEVGKKDQEIEKLKQEATSVQSKLNKALQVNTEAQKIIREHEQVIEVLQSESATQKRALEDSETVIRQSNDKIEQLKQIQPIEAYTPIQLIVTGILRMFRRR